MLLRPLRREALVLMSAADKSMRDVKNLFSHCMDPPPDPVVEGALHHLEQILAIESVGPGRWQATPLGRLLASMPVSLDAAVMVVRGAQQPFGDGDPNRFARRYLPASLVGEGGTVSESSRWLANLAAYEFWQRCWCDRFRTAAITATSNNGVPATSELEHLCAFLPKATALNAPATSSTYSATAHSPAAEADVGAQREAERNWCEAHNLILPALSGILDSVAALIAALHHHRPTFLSSQPNLPEYFERHVVPHRCRIVSDGPDGTDVLSRSYGTGSSSRNSSTASVSHTTKGSPAARNCSSILQCAHSRGGSLTSNLQTLLRPLLRNQPPPKRGGAKTCSFFARGSCIRGTSCRFLHIKPEVDTRTLRAQSVAAGKVDVQFEPDSKSPHAVLATLLATYIRQGQKDMVGGELVAIILTAPTAPLIIPASIPMSQSPALPYPLKVLFVGDGDLSFSASVSASLPRGSVLATTMLTRESLIDIHPGARAQLNKIRQRGSEVAFGINATTLESTTGQLPWSRICTVVWNFPHNGVEEDQAGDSRLMRDFFSSVSRLAVQLQWVRLPGDEAGAGRGAAQREMNVHITLCNDQYGRWGVDQLARESFWFMYQSQTFTPAHYPGYTPRRCPAEAVKRAEAGVPSVAMGEDEGFVPSKGITYSFRLALPQAA
eukprot:gene13650-19535_t